MAIRATCDGCFMEYKVPDDRAGKAFKCKECGEVVRVPSPGRGSAAATPAALPPRQRPLHGASKAAGRKRSKRPAKSNGNAVALAATVVGVVVAALAGYLMLSRGGGAVPDDAATAEAAASTPAVALSQDEENVLADLQQLARSQGQTSPEERKAAMEKFAADRGMTTADVTAVIAKRKQAYEAANHVDTRWQAISVNAPPEVVWPTGVNVQVPVQFGMAKFRIPKLRAPFLLASASTTSGIQRWVFELATSRQIGQWSSRIVAGNSEQPSPDGRLICLEEGVKPPITLHIVDAESGQPVQQITSPDLMRVAYLAFIQPDRLLVATPRTAERTKDKQHLLMIFDASTGRETLRFEHEFRMTADVGMSLSPDGRYLVVIGKGNSIDVLDLTSGRQVCVLDLKDEGLFMGILMSVSWSPDGRKIAVLEQQGVKALRLHVVESATGALASQADLFGAMRILGAPRDTSSHDSILWFPDGRYLLIGRQVVVDTATGRRVCHFQGDQVGSIPARLPTTGGLLYQVNSDDASRLVTLPIDFDRIAATQEHWPDDAALRPGMTVGITVDLSAGGLAELNDVVATGMKLKLEKIGFTVADVADPVLHVGFQDGAVRFAWTFGDETVWESVAAADTAMVPQVGHLRGYAVERALTLEGIVKLQVYPIPYFIAGDRTWTLPVVEQINHEG